MIVVVARLLYSLAYFTSLLARAAMLLRASSVIIVGSNLQVKKSFLPI